MANARLRKNIVTDILQECDRQDEQWGANRDHNPYIWMTILTEEIGEVANEILAVSFNGKPAGDLRYELVQCGAVIIQFIEYLDRTIFKPVLSRRNE